VKWQRAGPARSGMVALALASGHFGVAGVPHGEPMQNICDVAGVGLRVDARTAATTRVTLFGFARCSGRQPTFAFWLAPASWGQYHRVRGWSRSPLVALTIRHQPDVRVLVWVSDVLSGAPNNWAVGRYRLDRIAPGRT